MYQPTNQIKVPALEKPIFYWSRWTIIIVGKLHMLLCYGEKKRKCWARGIRRKQIIILDRQLRHRDGDI